MNKMSQSYSWKQYLYAFLLRRALGPYLTTQSAAGLHSSIKDVDWSEGKIVLVDVDLDADYLNGLIASNSSSEFDSDASNSLITVEIQKAKIRRFGINFSLSETSANSNDQAAPTTTARKATSALLRNIFGSIDEYSSGTSLVVHIELDGVDVELTPCRRNTQNNNIKQSPERQLHNNPSETGSTPPSAVEQDEVASSFFSSLADSAMKSLRLSINAKDVKLDLLTPIESQITLLLASARYYDLTDTKKQLKMGMDEAEKVIVSKAIDWSGLVVELMCKTGSYAEAHQLLQQSSGEGRVRFRCYEKWRQENINDSEPLTATGKRDIDISPGQHVAVNADSFVLNQLVIIFNALSSENLPFIDPSELVENDFDSTQDYTTSKLALADEFTREAYDEVMKQYTEARHLARTREIRGGVLIPSFEGKTDTGEVSFDAFFDANDHSISFYRDMIMEGTWSPTQNDKKHTIATITKIDFSLPEFTFKLGFGESVPDSSDSILLSMGNLQFIMYSEDGETKINASISHFEIDSRQTKNQSTMSINMLRFVDQVEIRNHSDLLVTSSPCISAYVELSKCSEGDTCSRIDLVLQSLEITFVHSVVSGLNRLVMLTGTKQQSPTDLRSTENAALLVSVSCESLVVLMACSNVTEADPLFSRCGYPLDSEDLRLNPFLGLGVEIDNISADFSDKCDEVKAVTKFSHACLFAKNTKLVSARRGRKRFVSSSYVSRRTDLLACTAEQDRASDSLIVASYTRFSSNEGTQRGKRSTSFPIILPLSSAKARQVDDSDDEDDFFEDILHSPGNVDSTKATDSQYIMSSEASEAQKEVVINIPCVSLDLTLCEKNELISILSDILPHTYQSKSSDHIDSCTGSNTRNWSSIALKVGQLSVVLFGNEQIARSYSFVCDDIQIHALVDRLSGLRNARVSAADFTLYELADLIDSRNSQPDNTSTVSCAERCRRVQERMILKRIFSVVRAIFFRSKLSQPILPGYPAILMDAILSRKHDSYAHSISEELDEKNVHFSVYDMTYRYSVGVGSNWLQNLRLLFQGESTGNESPSQTEELVEGIPCLTNLFVCVTDCNFDYTTPMAYKTASRSILRIGEVKLSSNLLTPCSEMQAYKLSLAEVGVFVCNYRHPYSGENASLSCAHRHFNEENISVADGDINLKDKALPTLVSTLSHMDFVNVVALDSIDAAILVNWGCGNTRSEEEKGPATTVALTMGKINCNFCRDSFTTTADTFNDWILRFTALSEEELDTLRSISEQQTQVVRPSSTNDSASNAIYEPSRSPLRSNPETDSSEVFRADSADVDKLTDTLLFHDYYTIDATNRPPVTRAQQMMQTPLTVVESSSSDDEWAAVEHSYLRNSNIPRENEQRAEWILCDTDSQSIKVFPQHFSAKPLLDCGRNHNTPDKVAGSHETPRVGLRLIVNDAAISLHFFDGMDWTTASPKSAERDTNDRRGKLLSDLLGDEEQAPDRTLNPLPDERSEILKRNCINKKLRRNHLRYFSVSASGLRLNNDSYITSAEHQLASCLDLAVADLFVAETISNQDPTKMVGEWVNEAEHPRDDSDGVIMLKMITKHPTIRVSADGKLMSDESQACLELLPLRLFFHQTSIRFMRSFFAREVSDTYDSSDNEDDMEIIPIFFSSFKVKRAKLKVDYTPEEMDVNSFRDGNYIEL